MQEKRTKKLRTRDFISFVITIILSLLFVYGGNMFFKPQKSTEEQGEFYRGKVIEIEEEDAQTETEKMAEEGNGQNTSVGEDATPENPEGDVSGQETTTGEGMGVKPNLKFKALVKSGPFRGAVVDAEQAKDLNIQFHSIPISQGDEIILLYDRDATTGAVTWYFAEYNRSSSLLILAVIFFALILLIGRLKGVATILSLALTTASIILVYVPGILAGANIYILTFVEAVFIIFMSLILMNGINIKSLTAIFGNLGGVIVAALIAYIMNSAMKMSGLISEDYVYLTMLDPENPISLSQVLWGGAVIGSLGAIMDVAMSLSSAMKELVQISHKDTGKGDLIKAGMRIGTDAIGTMTNTLILAYIGSSLAAVLLFTAYNRNIFYLFNLEFIAAEMVKSLAGSIGILFAVPITVVLSALIYRRGDKACIKSVYRDTKDKLDNL